MRLKQIKLAGFKSFVDPTVVPFPAAMTCVVGPNGCGKSNVIDAVRWVLGESSAKNLRGDAMTDVIFNGSTQRKPVSQASVELVFENTAGKLQGQLADRSEIALKRIVTRDAQSHYFLNGTKCRRRDITDIFLGTGLGPRSYAIIEQGMIARLIESKPQDLRIFLEEAAGISKYKERRRETETRIKHTRENLERLGDVREELGKNLEKLKRQAAVAERYKELKALERRYKAELTAIKFLFFNEKLQQAEGVVAEFTQQQAQIQQQHSAQFSQLTECKAQLSEARDTLSTSQQQYYQLGTELTALEQQMLHQRQRQQALQTEQQSLTLELQQQQERMQQEQLLFEDVQAALLELEPQQELQHMQIDEAMQQVADLEQEVTELDLAERADLQLLNDLTQQQQRFALQVQSQQQLAMQLQQRLLVLQQNLAECTALDVQEQMTQASMLLTEVQRQRDECQDEQQQHSVEQLAIQQQLQQVQFSKVSLQQQIKANQQQQLELERALAQVLAQHPLLPQLEIVTDWSVAIAMALGGLNFAAVLDSASHSETAHNNYLLTMAPAAVDHPQGRLSEQVLAGPVPSYFQHIWTAATLAQALEKVPQLAPYESVICQDGHWFGPNWHVLASPQQQQNSTALAVQLEALQCHAEQMQQAWLDAEAEEVRLTAQLELCTQALLHVQQQLAALQQQVFTQQTTQQLLLQQQQQSAARQQQLQQEVHQLELQSREHQQLQAEYQQQADEVAGLLQQQQQSREPMQQRQQQLQRHLQQQQAQLRQLQQQQQQTALTKVSLERQFDAAKLHVQRSLQQQQQLNSRLVALTAQLELLDCNDDTDTAGQQAQLLQLMQQRDSLASTNLRWQQQIQDLETQIRQLELVQLQGQQHLQLQQQQLEQARLDAESYRVRASGMLEMLTEQKVNFSELQQQLPADASESQWQLQLDKISDALSRLGPINLAAIEEYTQQAERKAYLDQQDQDLMSALETLETAIRKIDRETRQKFKETFDMVNSGLQTLFPKVFGGGSAYLELTDEDLLETGVSIMARPPGKKNSTIHLLSGGEKALTALSLVFSIFRLNPAPFCMLDEVDAPLDDANVGRFCNLVREMSETVQFIYISHNKIAMEMATQLMGVTMQEPGVSRVVAVDVADAVKLAQA